MPGDTSKPSKVRRKASDPSDVASAVKVDAVTKCSICGGDDSDICRHKLCETCCHEAQSVENVDACTAHGSPSDDDDSDHGEDGGGGERKQHGGGGDKEMSEAQLRVKQLQLMKDALPTYRFVGVTSPWLAYDAPSLVAHELRTGAVGRAYELVQKKVELWQVLYRRSPQNADVESYLKQTGEILERGVPGDPMDTVRLLKEPLKRLCALIHVRAQTGKAGVREFEKKLQVEDVPTGYVGASEAATAAAAKVREEWSKRRREEHDDSDGGGRRGSRGGRKWGDRGRGRSGSRSWGYSDKRGDGAKDDRDKKSDKSKDKGKHKDKEKNEGN